MKHEMMLRAIGEIDDDLVAQAHKRRAKAHKGRALPRMLAAAACLALILTAAFTASRSAERVTLFIGGTALTGAPVPIDSPAPGAAWTHCRCAWRSRSRAGPAILSRSPFRRACWIRPPIPRPARFPRAAPQAAKRSHGRSKRPTKIRATPYRSTARLPPCCAMTAQRAAGSPSGPESTKQHILHLFWR